MYGRHVYGSTVYGGQRNGIIRVLSSLIAKWNVRNFVESPHIIKWNIRNFMTSDSNFKWNINNLITSLLTLKWRVGLWNNVNKPGSINYSNITKPSTPSYTTVTKPTGVWTDVNKPE